MRINEWDTAMLLTELWIENWQVCSCGTIQILKAREKDNEVTKKKGETLIKKKKNGGQIGVCLTLHSPF